LYVRTRTEITFPGFYIVTVIRVQQNKTHFSHAELTDVLQHVTT